MSGASSCRSSRCVTRALQQIEPRVGTLEVDEGQVEPDDGSLLARNLQHIVANRVPVLSAVDDDALQGRAQVQLDGQLAKRLLAHQPRAEPHQTVGVQRDSVHAP